jgi:hypothetical protein
MMGTPNFGDEFKRGAVPQITEHEYSVAEVRSGSGAVDLVVEKATVKVVSGDASKDAAAAPSGLAMTAV